MKLRIAAAALYLWGATLVIGLITTGVLSSLEVVGDDVVSLVLAAWMAITIFITCSWFIGRASFKIWYFILTGRRYD